MTKCPHFLCSLLERAPPVCLVRRSHLRYGRFSAAVQIYHIRGRPQCSAWERSRKEKHLKPLHCQRRLYVRVAGTVFRAKTPGLGGRAERQNLCTLILVFFDPFGSILDKSLWTLRPQSHIFQRWRWGGWRWLTWMITSGLNETHLPGSRGRGRGEIKIEQSAQWGLCHPPPATCLAPPGHLAGHWMPRCPLGIAQMHKCPNAEMPGC